MSVAFRRENDDEHLEPTFELPIPPGPNLVTARGLALIQQTAAAMEDALDAADQVGGIGLGRLVVEPGQGPHPQPVGQGLRPSVHGPLLGCAVLGSGLRPPGVQQTVTVNGAHGPGGVGVYPSVSGRVGGVGVAVGP